MDYMENIKEWMRRRSDSERFAILFLVVSILFYIIDPITISIVLGQSMEPTYSHGDIVVYSDWVEPEVDAVVVFSNQEGTLVVHRLVEKRENGIYLARGDNNKQVDHTFVTKANYRGTVLFHLNTSSIVPPEGDVADLSV